MTTYTVAPRAYALPLFHALKYPYAEVNGVLLAKQANANTIEIVDAVPLFHQWTQLSAMFEIALQQIELYASKNNLRIIGYYHANEDIKERTLNATASKIADKIHTNTGKESVIFLVENDKIDLETSEPALLPFVHAQNQWQPVRSSFASGSKFQFQNPDTLATVRFQIGEKRFRNIVDFDNYLDNVTADWLKNPEVGL